MGFILDIFKFIGAIGFIFTIKIICLEILMDAPKENQVLFAIIFLIGLIYLAYKLMYEEIIK